MANRVSKFFLFANKKPLITRGSVLTYIKVTYQKLRFLRQQENTRWVNGQVRVVRNFRVKLRGVKLQ